MPRLWNGFIIYVEWCSRGEDQTTDLQHTFRPDNPTAIFLLNLLLLSLQQKVLHKISKPQVVSSVLVGFFFLFGHVPPVGANFQSIISTHGWSKGETKKEPREAISLLSTPLAPKMCSYIPRCCWNYINPQPSLPYRILFPCPPSILTVASNGSSQRKTPRCQMQPTYSKETAPASKCSHNLKQGEMRGMNQIQRTMKKDGKDIIGTGPLTDWLYSPSGFLESLAAPQSTHHKD